MSNLENTEAESMTISEALREIADVKGKIDEWQKHLQPAIFYYNSDEPAFDVGTVKDELTKLTGRLIKLKSSVAVTNAKTVVWFDAEQFPLSVLVNALSELKGEIARVKALSVKNAKSGVEKSVDYTYDDNGKRIKDMEEKAWTCCLTTAEKMKEVERLQSLFNEINRIVEAANNKTRIEMVLGSSQVISKRGRPGE